MDNSTVQTNITKKQQLFYFKLTKFTHEQVKIIDEIRL